MPSIAMEKRAHQRVPLDIPFFVSIWMQEDVELPVQLIDCSRGGLQLAFSPAAEQYRDILNRRVRILRLPGAMDPDQSGVEGFVAWTGLGRCGIRFDAPLQITEGEIRAIAAEL